MFFDPRLRRLKQVAFEAMAKYPSSALVYKNSLADKELCPLPSTPEELAAEDRDSLYIYHNGLQSPVCLRLAISRDDLTASESPENPSYILATAWNINSDGSFTEGTSVKTQMKGAIEILEDLLIEADEAALQAKDLYYHYAAPLKTKLSESPSGKKTTRLLQKSLDALFGSKDTVPPPSGMA